VPIFSAPLGALDLKVSNLKTTEHAPLESKGLIPSGRGVGEDIWPKWSKIMSFGPFWSGYALKPCGGAMGCITNTLCAVLPFSKPFIKYSPSFARFVLIANRLPNLQNVQNVPFWVKNTPNGQDWPGQLANPAARPSNVVAGIFLKMS
jgi:hypothetical protein